MQSYMHYIYSGLTGKDWNILKHINENLTATIRTQYGNTRTIKIKDSIRQGGVLSGNRVCQPNR